MTVQEKLELLSQVEAKAWDALVAFKEFRSLEAIDLCGRIKARILNGSSRRIGLLPEEVK